MKTSDAPAPLWTEIKVDPQMALHLMRHHLRLALAMFENLPEELEYRDLIGMIEAGTDVSGPEASAGRAFVTAAFAWYKAAAEEEEEANDD